LRSSTVDSTPTSVLPPSMTHFIRHYSPQAKVILFEENEQENWMKTKITDRLEVELKQGKRVAVIHTHPSISYTHSNSNYALFYDLGDNQHPESVAKGLFTALRELDSLKVDIILMEGISEKREGLAVMNRIRKAATEIISGSS